MEQDSAVIFVRWAFVWQVRYILIILLSFFCSKFRYLGNASTWKGLFDGTSAVWSVYEFVWVKVCDCFVAMRLYVGFLRRVQVSLGLAAVLMLEYEFFVSLPELS